MSEGARFQLRAAARAGLAWLAAGAAARVFVLEGANAPAPVDALRLKRELQLVDTPRSATVLLVAGLLPPSLSEAATRAHDAMGEPRATLWWAREADTQRPPPFASAIVVAARAGSSDAEALTAITATLGRVHAELLNRLRPSATPLLPDEPPAPWYGVGPYGQGGSGMTGGVPYGRPMAGRAPDRDGLELDQLPLRIGPFFAPFPPGLVLDVKLQGDVIQELVVPGNAYADNHSGVAGWTNVQDPFRAALQRPVRIADIERNRASHHLRWLASALRMHGLSALAHRALALAISARYEREPGTEEAVAALERLLERTRSLAWATADVGRIDGTAIANRGLGPVARAAGLVEDARLEDPAYQQLGFDAVLRGGRGGDATSSDADARWRQRLREARQSLTLSDRAGERCTGGDGRPVEGPHGRLSSGDEGPSPSAVLLGLLPELLSGQEWGDAVTTVVSLDLDVLEAASNASPLAAQPGPALPTDMSGMTGMSGMNRESSAPQGSHDMAAM